MGQNNIAFSNKSLEFLQVCTEFCKYVEHLGNIERDEFIDVMRGLLSMLYLKATLFPELNEQEGYNEPHVTEDDYNFIRRNVAHILAEKDDYLDVFIQDFKYADQPILRTISEGIADIYQVLRDLTETYKGGYEEAIEVALYDTMDAFKTYWGQTSLNTLKALHDARFNLSE